MSKLLVKYQVNWADEMDLKGFKIYDSQEDFENDIQDFLDENCGIPTEDYITEIMEEATRFYLEDDYDSVDEFIKYEYSEVFKFRNKFYNSDFEAWVGTNEFIQYSTIDDFLENFECIEISDETAAQLEKLFEPNFRTFPIF